MQRRSLPAGSRLFVLCGLVVANLLPLVGVVVWNWDVSTLLVLYYVEGVSTTLVAGVKVLFAERASREFGTSNQPLAELREKRGGWVPRRGWPPMYVRNVPFALTVLGVFTFVWLGYGVVLSFTVAVRLETVLSTVLVVNAAVLLVSHLVEFRTEYIGSGECATVSARMVAATPARQLLLLICLVPFAGLVGSGAGDLLLGAVVCAKLAAELAGFYAEHAGRPSGRIGRLLVGPRDTSAPPPELDLPDRRPDARVRPDTRAVLLGGLAPILTGFASRPGYLAGVVLVFGVLVFSPTVVAAAATALALVAAGKLASHYLRYGTVEYQRRGEQLVAYDTALDEPQWATTVTSLDGVSAANHISDRVLGTTTLSIAGIESDERDGVKLGPVANATEAVARLDLPVDDAALQRPSADHEVLAVAVVLGLCFAFVPVGLFVAPGVETKTAVGVTLLLGPFFLVVVGLLVVSGLSRI